MNLKQWKNKEYKNRVITKIMKTVYKKPNKKEKFLDDVIQSNFSNEWKLNVLPNLTILNGRIPDWINCNGQKKVINHNGIYWHLENQLKEFHKKGLFIDSQTLSKEQVEEIEKKPYEELGYKILFIWEDELNDEGKVVEKIRNFTKKEGE